MTPVRAPDRYFPRGTDRRRVRPESRRPCRRGDRHRRLRPRPALGVLLAARRPARCHRRRRGRPPRPADLPRPAPVDGPADPGAHRPRGVHLRDRPRRGARLGGRRRRSGAGSATASSAASTGWAARSWASAQGILVIWLAGGILAAGAIPPAAAMAQTSIVVRALADALPPPTEFAGGLGQLLDASGLPQVFAGLRAIPGAAGRDAEQPGRQGTHRGGRGEHGQGAQRCVRLRAERDGLLDRHGLLRDQRPRRRRGHEGDDRPGRRQAGEGDRRAVRSGPRRRRPVGRRPADRAAHVRRRTIPAPGSRARRSATRSARP